MIENILYQQSPFFNIFNNDLFNHISTISLFGIDGKPNWSINQVDQPSYHNANMPKRKLVVISYLPLLHLSYYFSLYTFDHVDLVFLPLTNQFLLSPFDPLDQFLLFGDILISFYISLFDNNAKDLASLNMQL